MSKKQLNAGLAVRVKAPVEAPIETIAHRIYAIRSQKVMLDSALAGLYQVPTSRLNEAVKRNPRRFPDDFMFRLTKEEARCLISQNAIPIGRGGRRTQPYAFTELGVAMLSSVLKSERAVQMNIVIMRAFVKLRELLANNKDLARRIGRVEAKQRQHSSFIVGVVNEINAMKKLPPSPRKRPIGFTTQLD